MKGEMERYLEGMWRKGERSFSEGEKEEERDRDEG